MPLVSIVRTQFISIAPLKDNFLTRKSHFLCSLVSSPFLPLAGQQHASTHGGFEHRNWNKDIIHLRYELQHVYSEWEELFLSQKPFAVRDSHSSPYSCVILF